MDGPIVAGSIVAVDWRGVCKQLMERVLETIFGSQIYMNWLRINFGGLDVDSSEVQREQHARAYILMIIGGLLMLDKSRNLVYLRWLLKFVGFRGETNSVGGQSCWRRCTERCVERQNHKKTKIGGCMLLLQLWAWYRLSFLHSREDYHYTSHL
ncbi:hypothetical protein PVK06_007000 [Gossypium arboreum]|uniref:Aminotransferase-like plant mobile domain-containing protein n=1 Tax=Gossypium arboreum TaxID=29729 RepID=A0ABR0QG33_GOSAR|nr:hypothetical protein PVK06_007000 [Gossypium arboreum]